MAPASNDPGPGVDIAGHPVRDPTENVKDLMDASIKRIDDLREMETRHQDRIRILMMGHVTEMANLRGEFGEKLRNAESDRINAIRAVDVAAVQRAAEVADLRAQTLAAQVAQSAETLRVQVAAVAAASATELTRALEPIQRAIDDLRKSQYEAQGQKTQVVEARGSSTTMIAMAAIGISFMILLVAVAGFLVAKP
jgi:cobalamin biosynthesis Mg chelatase CobN